MLTYLKKPEDKLWDEINFCMTYFLESQRYVYALKYDFTFEGFVGDSGNEVLALLPAGWAATEILVRESKFTNTVADHYDNGWGYVTCLGPIQLIQELTALEQERIAIDKKIKEFAGRLTDCSPERAKSYRDGKYIGCFQVPARAEPFRPSSKEYKEKLQRVQSHR